MAKRIPKKRAEEQDIEQEHEENDIEEEEIEVPGPDEDISGYDDYDELEEDGGGSSSRRSTADDLKAIDTEVAFRANPKRAKYLRQAARKFEGIPSTKVLTDPETALKVWKQLEKSHGKQKAKPYRIDANFTLEDIIDHPKFGRGYVAELLSETKCSVLFEEGLRRLVYNSDL